MKVLVTGATGFIGYEVARRLAESGDRPRLVVRRPDRAALLSKLDAELIHADLDSPSGLRRAADGVDAVIHLAARATFEDYRVVSPSIVGGSVSLMEAAADAGVRRFVYGSSLLVYGNQSRPIDATTPVGPSLDYGRAKVEAERRLERIAERSGVRLCSVRLSHVYGARDLMFSRISRGRIIVPGSARNFFAHVHVDDAARVLIEAARRDVTGAWPLGDDRSTSWIEFFETLREYYPRLRWSRVPQWLARAGTELLRPLQYVRRRPVLATPGTVVGWNLNAPVAPGVLWNELDLRPLHPTIREGIPAALDASVAYRWLHPVEDRIGW